MAKAKNVMPDSVVFQVHEDRSRRPPEWVLRLHYGDGSFFSLGGLNAKDEAEMVKNILNDAVQSKRIVAMREISNYLRDVG